MSRAAVSALPSASTSRARPVDEGELAGLSDAAANVAGLYASLRDDIREGTRFTPSFWHATRLTRIVETLFASSDRGEELPIALE